jgi:hypothetical protein
MTIVMQAASTGIEIISNKEVKKIDQLKSSMKLNKYSSEKDDTDKMLEIKFILPNREERPAICKLKKRRSMEE